MQVCLNSYSTHFLYLRLVLLGSHVHRTHFRTCDYMYYPDFLSVLVYGWLIFTWGQHNLLPHIMVAVLITILLDALYSKLPFSHWASSLKVLASLSHWTCSSVEDAELKALPLRICCGSGHHQLDLFQLNHQMRAQLRNQMVFSIILCWKTEHTSGYEDPTQWNFWTD